MAACMVVMPFHRSAEQIPCDSSRTHDNGSKPSMLYLNIDNFKDLSQNMNNYGTAEKLKLVYF